MAIKSGIFDSTEIVQTESGYPRGNRAVDAAFFARYFASFIGNGVYAGVQNCFKVMAYSGMKIKLCPGKAFINGYFAFTDSEEYLDLTSGAEAKTSRVVLRLNLANGEITAAIKEGDLTPTRTAYIYELVLADIAVAAEAETITDAEITDRRSDSTLCGFVSGVIQQIDISTLDAQARAYFAAARAYTDEKKAEITALVAHAHTILSDDEIAKLSVNKAQKDFSNVEDGSLKHRHLDGELAELLGVCTGLKML